MQTVNSNSDEAKCTGCGANIADIANFAYDNKTVTEPTYREELCVCRKCKTQFIMHYDLFDNEGHVLSRVFTEDSNDPTFKWSDILTQPQLDLIIKHLRTCDICKKRLDSQLLSDAWFSSLLNEVRKNGLS